MGGTKIVSNSRRCTMDIGNKIQTIRTNNGMTQAEFAEKFNVTRQSVSNWENNKNYPDMETLKKISDTFQISFDELLKDDRELMAEIDQTRKKAKRLRWVGLLAAVMILLLLGLLVLPKAVSAFYYNPLQVVAKAKDGDGEMNREAGRLQTDISVYSELFLPCRHFDSVYVRDLGLGKYGFTIGQSTWPSGAIQKQVNGEIVRNQMVLYDPSILQKPTGNAFEWTINHHDVNESILKSLEDNQKEHLKENPGSSEDDVSFSLGLAGDPKFASQQLQGLDDHRLYLAYVSFNRVMDYDDARKMADQYELISPWMGIVTDRDFNEVIGLNSSYETGVMLPFDQKKYPFLLGSDDFELTQEVDLDRLEQEKYARKHMISMLSYMKQQKIFCRMMDPLLFDKNGAGSDYFQSKIDYISKHGLTVYGIAVIADKAALLSIDKEENVFSIATEIY